MISQNESMTIPIQSGPGVTYSQIGELRIGDIITTLASENDWVKHDKSGWSCQYHDNTKVLRPYTSHKDVNQNCFFQVETNIVKEYEFLTHQKHLVSIKENMYNLVLFCREILFKNFWQKKHFSKT